MADQAPEIPSYQGLAFFSYGFRPFFLGAALFAGFHMAMYVSAGVSVVAAAVALTMLGGVKMKDRAG